MTTPSDEFIRWVNLERPDLKDRYDMKEIFEYDYKADAMDWNRLSSEKSYERFYLTGHEMLDAFRAGYERGREGSK
jgi:hypothetical protein